MDDQKKKLTRSQKRTVKKNQRKKSLSKKSLLELRKKTSKRKLTTKFKRKQLRIEGKKELLFINIEE